MLFGKQNKQKIGIFSMWAHPIYSICKSIIYANRYANKCDLENTIQIPTVWRVQIRQFSID